MAPDSYFPRQIEKLVEEIRRHAPTVDPVKDSIAWQSRQGEYDLVIFFQASSDAHPGPYTISVGASRCGTYPTDLDDVFVMAERWRTTSAREFIQPSIENPEIERLVERELAPLVQGRVTNSCISLSVVAPLLKWKEPKDYLALQQVTNRVIKEFIDSTTKPLLYDSGKNIIAFFYENIQDGTQHWCLPEGVDIAVWVRELIKIWHARSPEMFPIRSKWKDIAKFQTTEEAEKIREINSFMERRRTLIAELDARENELKESLEKAHQAAEAGVRRLVTSQGSTLVYAVRDSLEYLGFTVRESDADSTPGDLLEDLQISDSNHAGWVALTEVRGYAGGAKVNDLLRTTRFATRYAASTGNPPSAIWYIVNSFIGRTPSERIPPFQSNPNEINSYGEHHNGLIIDTTELLSAHLAAKCGKVSAATIRRSLATSCGRWSLSAVERNQD